MSQALLSPVQLSLFQQIYNAILHNSPFFTSSDGNLIPQKTPDDPSNKKRGFLSRLFGSSDGTDVKYIIQLLEQLIGTTTKENIPLLLDHTENPFFSNFTILGFAAYHSHYDIVKWLYKHNASLISCHATTGQTPLMLTCATPFFTGQTVKLIKFFVDQYSDPNFTLNNTPTHTLSSVPRRHSSRASFSSTGNDGDTRQRARSASAFRSRNSKIEHSKSSKNDHHKNDPKSNQTSASNQYTWLIYRDCNQLSAPSYILRTNELFSEYHYESLEYLFAKCPMLYLIELSPKQIEEISSKLPQAQPLQSLIRALRGQVSWSIVNGLGLKMSNSMALTGANNINNNINNNNNNNNDNNNNNNHNNNITNTNPNTPNNNNPNAVVTNNNNSSGLLQPPAAPKSLGNGSEHHYNPDPDNIVQPHQEEEEHHEENEIMCPFNTISTFIKTHHSNPLPTTSSPVTIAPNNTKKGYGKADGKGNDNGIGSLSSQQHHDDVNYQRAVIIPNPHPDQITGPFQTYTGPKDNPQLLMPVMTMSYLPILHLFSNQNQIKTTIWKKIYKLIVKYIPLENTPLLSIPGTSYQQAVQLGLFSRPFPHISIVASLKRDYNASFYFSNTLGLSPIFLTLLHSQPWGLETTKLIYLLTDPNTSPLSLHMLRPTPPNIKAEKKQIRPDMLTSFEFALLLSNKPYIAKAALLLFKLLAEVDVETINRVVEYQAIHDLFSPISSRNPHFVAKVIDFFGDFQNFQSLIPANSVFFQQNYGLPYQKSDALSTFAAMYHHSHVIPSQITPMIDYTNANGGNPTWHHDTNVTPITHLNNFNLDYHLPNNKNTTSTASYQNYQQSFRLDTIKPTPMDLYTILDRHVKFDPYFNSNNTNNRLHLFFDPQLPTSQSIHTLPPTLALQQVQQNNPLFISPYQATSPSTSPLLDPTTLNGNGPNVRRTRGQSIASTLPLNQNGNHDNKNRPRGVSHGGQQPIVQNLGLNTNPTSPQAPLPNQQQQGIKPVYGPFNQNSTNLLPFQQNFGHYGHFNPTLPSISTLPPLVRDNIMLQLQHAIISNVQYEQQMKKNTFVPFAKLSPIPDLTNSPNTTQNTNTSNTQSLALSSTISTQLQSTPQPMFTLLNIDNPITFPTPFAVHFPVTQAIKYFHTQHPPPQTILTPHELERNQFDTVLTAIGPQRSRSKLENHYIYRSQSAHLYSREYTVDELAKPHPCFLYTTPLHLLCSHPMYSLDIIFYLWSNGADLNITRHGDEPLLYFITQTYTSPALSNDTTTGLFLEQLGYIQPQLPQPSTFMLRIGARSGHRRQKSRTGSIATSPLLTLAGVQMYSNDNGAIGDNTALIAGAPGSNDGLSQHPSTTQQYLQQVIPPYTGMIYPLDEPTYAKGLEKAVSKIELQPEEIVIANDVKKLPKEHNIDKLSVFLHCILRHQTRLGLKSPSHQDFQDDDVRRNMNNNNGSSDDNGYSPAQGQNGGNSPNDDFPQHNGQNNLNGQNNNLPRTASILGAHGVNANGMDSTRKKDNMQFKSPLAADYSFPYEPALADITPLDFTLVTQNYHGFFYYLLCNPSIAPRETREIGALMLHYQQINPHLVLEDIFSFIHNPLNQKLGLSYAPLQALLEVIFSQDELLHAMSSHQNFLFREFGLNADLLHIFLLSGNLLLPSAFDLYLFFLQIGFQPASTGAGPILECLGDPLLLGPRYQNNTNSRNNHPHNTSQHNNLNEDSRQTSPTLVNTRISATTSHIRQTYFGSVVYSLYVLISILMKYNPTFPNSPIAVALFSHLKMLAQNQNVERQHENRFGNIIQQSDQSLANYTGNNNTNVLAIQPNNSPQKDANNNTKDNPMKRNSVSSLGPLGHDPGLDHAINRYHNGEYGNGGSNNSFSQSNSGWENKSNYSFSVTTSTRSAITSPLSPSFAALLPHRITSSIPIIGVIPIPKMIKMMLTENVHLTQTIIPTCQLFLLEALQHSLYTPRSQTSQKLLPITSQHIESNRGAAHRSAIQIHLDQHSQQQQFSNFLDNIAQWRGFSTSIRFYIYSLIQSIKLLIMFDLQQHLDIQMMEQQQQQQGLLGSIGKGNSSAIFSNNHSVQRTSSFQRSTSNLVPSYIEDSEGIDGFDGDEFKNRKGSNAKNRKSDKNDKKEDKNQRNPIPQPLSSGLARTASNLYQALGRERLTPLGYKEVTTYPLKRVGKTNVEPINHHDKVDNNHSNDFPTTPNSNNNGNNNTIFCSTTGNNANSSNSSHNLDGKNHFNAFASPSIVVSGITQQLSLQNHAQQQPHSNNKQQKVLKPSSNRTGGGIYATIGGNSGLKQQQNIVTNLSNFTQTNGSNNDNHSSNNAHTHHQPHQLVHTQSLTHHAPSPRNNHLNNSFSSNTNIVSSTRHNDVITTTTHTALNAQQQHYYNQQQQQAVELDLKSLIFIACLLEEAPTTHLHAPQWKNPLTMLQSSIISPSHDTISAPVHMNNNNNNSTSTPFPSLLPTPPPAVSSGYMSSTNNTNINSNTSLNLLTEIKGLLLLLTDWSKYRQLDVYASIDTAKAFTETQQQSHQLTFGTKYLPTAPQAYYALPPSQMMRGVVGYKQHVSMFLLGMVLFTPFTMSLMEVFTISLQLTTKTHHQQQQKLATIAQLGSFSRNNENNVAPTTTKLLTANIPSQVSRHRNTAISPRGTSANSSGSAMGSFKQRNPVIHNSNQNTQQNNNNNNPTPSPVHSNISSNSTLGFAQQFNNQHNIVNTGIVNQPTATLNTLPSQQLTKLTPYQITQTFTQFPHNNNRPPILTTTTNGSSSTSHSLVLSPTSRQLYLNPNDLLYLLLNLPSIVTLNTSNPAPLLPLFEQILKNFSHISLSTSIRQEKPNSHPLLRPEFIQRDFFNMVGNDKDPVFAVLPTLLTYFGSSFFPLLCPYDERMAKLQRLSTQMGFSVGSSSTRGGTNSGEKSLVVLREQVAPFQHSFGILPSSTVTPSSNLSMLDTTLPSSSMIGGTTANENSTNNEKNDKLSKNDKGGKNDKKGSTTPETHSTIPQMSTQLLSMIRGSLAPLPKVEHRIDGVGGAVGIETIDGVLLKPPVDLTKGMPVALTGFFPLIYTNASPLDGKFKPSYDSHGNNSGDNNNNNAFTFAGAHHSTQSDDFYHTESLISLEGYNALHLLFLPKNLPAPVPNSAVTTQQSLNLLQGHSLFSSINNSTNSFKNNSVSGQSSTQQSSSPSIIAGGKVVITNPTKLTSHIDLRRLTVDITDPKYHQDQSPHMSPTASPLSLPHTFNLDGVKRGKNLELVGNITQMCEERVQLTSMAMSNLAHPEEFVSSTPRAGGQSTSDTMSTIRGNNMNSVRSNNGHMNSVRSTNGKGVFSFDQNSKNKSGLPSSPLASNTPKQPNFTSVTTCQPLHAQLQHDLMELFLNHSKNNSSPTRSPTAQNTPLDIYTTTSSGDTIIDLLLFSPCLLYGKRSPLCKQNNGLFCKCGYTEQTIQMVYSLLTNHDFNPNLAPISTFSQEYANLIPFNGGLTSAQALSVPLVPQSTGTGGLSSMGNNNTHHGHHHNTGRQSGGYYNQYNGVAIGALNPIASIAEDSTTMSRHDSFNNVNDNVGVNNLNLLRHYSGIMGTTPDNKATAQKRQSFSNIFQSAYPNNAGNFGLNTFENQYQAGGRKNKRNSMHDITMVHNNYKQPKQSLASIPSPQAAVANPSDLSFNRLSGSSFQQNPSFNQIGTSFNHNNPSFNLLGQPINQQYSQATNPAAQQPNSQLSPPPLNQMPTSPTLSMTLSSRISIRDRGQHSTLELGSGRTVGNQLRGEMMSFRVQDFTNRMSSQPPNNPLGASPSSNNNTPVLGPLDMADDDDDFKQPTTPQKYQPRQGYNGIQVGIPGSSSPTLESTPVPYSANQYLDQRYLHHDATTAQALASSGTLSSSDSLSSSSSIAGPNSPNHQNDVGAASLQSQTILATATALNRQGSSHTLTLNRQGSSQTLTMNLNPQPSAQPLPILSQQLSSQQQGLQRSASSSSLAGSLSHLNQIVASNSQCDDAGSSSGTNGNNKVLTLGHYVSTNQLPSPQGRMSVTQPPSNPNPLPPPPVLPQLGNENSDEGYYGNTLYTPSNHRLNTPSNQHNTPIITNTSTNNNPLSQSNPSPDLGMSVTRQSNNNNNNKPQLISATPGRPTNFGLVKPGLITNNSSNPISKTPGHHHPVNSTAGSGKGKGYFDGPVPYEVNEYDHEHKSSSNSTVINYTKGQTPDFIALSPHDEDPSEFTDDDVIINNRSTCNNIPLPTGNNNNNNNITATFSNFDGVFDNTDGENNTITGQVYGLNVTLPGQYSDQDDFFMPQSSGSNNYTAATTTTPGGGVGTQGHNSTMVGLSKSFRHSSNPSNNHLFTSTPSSLIHTSPHQSRSLAESKLLAPLFTDDHFKALEAIYDFTPPIDTTTPHSLRHYFSPHSSTLETIFSLYHHNILPLTLHVPHLVQVLLYGDHFIKPYREALDTIMLVTGPRCNLLWSFLSPGLIPPFLSSNQEYHQYYSTLMSYYGTVSGGANNNQIQGPGVNPIVSPTGLSIAMPITPNNASMNKPRPLVDLGFPAPLSPRLSGTHQTDDYNMIFPSQLMGQNSHPMQPFNQTNVNNNNNVVNNHVSTHQFPSLARKNTSNSMKNVHHQAGHPTVIATNTVNQYQPPQQHPPTFARSGSLGNPTTTYAIPPITNSQATVPPQPQILSRQHASASVDGGQYYTTQQLQIDQFDRGSVRLSTMGQSNIIPTNSMTIALSKNGSVDGGANGLDKNAKPITLMSIFSSHSGAQNRNSGGSSSSSRLGPSHINLDYPQSIHHTAALSQYSLTSLGSHSPTVYHAGKPQKKVKLTRAQKIKNRLSAKQILFQSNIAIADPVTKMLKFQKLHGQNIITTPSQPNLIVTESHAGYLDHLKNRVKVSMMRKTIIYREYAQILYHIQRETQLYNAANGINVVGHSINESHSRANANFKKKPTTSDQRRSSIVSIAANAEIAVRQANNPNSPSNVAEVASALHNKNVNNNKNDQQQNNQQGQLSSIFRNLDGTSANGNNLINSKQQLQLNNVNNTNSPRSLAKDVYNTDTSNIPSLLPPMVNHYWYQILDLLLATGCDLPLFIPTPTSTPSKQLSTPSIWSLAPIAPIDTIMLNDVMLKLPEARFISMFINAALDSTKYYSPLPDSLPKSLPQAISPAFIPNILNTQLNVIIPILNYILSDSLSNVNNNTTNFQQIFHTSSNANNNNAMTTPIASKQTITMALYILSHSLFWQFNPSSHRGNTQYLTPLQAFANHNQLREQVLANASPNLMLLSVTSITKLSLFDLLQVTTTPSILKIDPMVCDKDSIPLPFGIEWNGPFDPRELNYYNPGLVMNGGLPLVPNNEIVFPPHFLWDLFRSTPFTKQINKCNLYDLMILLTNCCYNPMRYDELVISYEMPKFCEIFMLPVEEIDEDRVISEYNKSINGSSSSDNKKEKKDKKDKKDKNDKYSNGATTNHQNHLEAPVQLPPNEAILYVHYQPYVNQHISNPLHYTNVINGVSMSSSDAMMSRQQHLVNQQHLLLAANPLSLDRVTVITPQNTNINRTYHIMNTPHGFDITMRDPDSLTGETLLQHALVRKMPSCVLFALIALYGIEQIVEPINGKFKPVVGLLGKNNNNKNQPLKSSNDTTHNNQFNDYEEDEEQFYPYSNTISLHVDFAGRNILDYMLAFHTVRHAPEVFNYILSFCDQEVLQELQRDGLL